MGICSGKNLPKDLDDLTNDGQFIVGYHNGVAIKELCTCTAECTHDKSNHKKCVSAVCAYSIIYAHQYNSEEYENVLFI